METHPSPVGVVWGADDPVAVVAMTQTFNAACPRAPITILEALLGFTIGNPGADSSPSYVGTEDVILIYENGGLGVAVMHLDYREDAKRSESYLTLVFEHRDGEWLMVQDQNTPVAD